MSSPSNAVLIDLYPTVKLIQDKMKDFLDSINAMLNGLDWMNSDIHHIFVEKNVPAEFMDSATIMKLHSDQLLDMKEEINVLFDKYGGLLSGTIDKNSKSLKNTGVFTKFLNLSENFTTTDVVTAINEILIVYNAENNSEFIGKCDIYFNTMRELLYMFMFNVDGTINHADLDDEMHYYNIILSNNAYYSRLPYVMNNIGFLLLSFLNYIKVL